MVSGTVEINSATPDQRQVHPVLPRDLLDVDRTAVARAAGRSQPARVPEATATCKIQRFKLRQGGIRGILPRRWSGQGA